MKPRTAIIVIFVILSISITAFVWSCSMLMDEISERGMKNIVEEIWEGSGETR